MRLVVFLAVAVLLQSSRSEAVSVARSWLCFFEPDSAELTPDCQNQLRLAASMLDAYFSGRVEYRPTRVEIRGHTDLQEARGHRQQLSDRRAQSVVGFLILSGIARERLSWAGFGDRQILATGRRGLADQMNRRVEIIVH